MLTQQKLKEILDYDKDTGLFIWKISRQKIVKGSVAGSENPQGYIRITIDGATHRAHRLAWLFVYGTFPENQIDHINTIKTDNRIANLRDVSNRSNNQNRKCHRNGKLVGCYFNKQSRKWKARIEINRKQVHLGYFATELEAHEAYMKALTELV
jgi:hypothetical protein